MLAESDSARLIQRKPESDSVRRSIFLATIDSQSTVYSRGCQKTKPLKRVEKGPILMQPKIDEASLSGYGTWSQ